MDTNTTMHTRRREFIRGIALTALLGAVPVTLTACAGLQPRPFIAGVNVNPPTGCLQLRSDNAKEADC